MSKIIQISPDLTAEIIHPTWNDERFHSFGINIGGTSETVTQTATSIIQGRISKQIREALKHHGFGLIKGVQQTTDELNDYWLRAPHKLNNDYWHADWRNEHVLALYFPPQVYQRKYQTGIIGKTRFFEELAKRANDIESTDKYDGWREYRKQVADASRIIASEHTAYSTETNTGKSFRPFEIVRMLHHQAFHDTTFMREVTDSLKTTGDIHFHTWEHGDLLLLDGETLHARIITEDTKSGATADQSWLLRLIIDDNETKI